MILNTSKFTGKISKGTVVGEAFKVCPVEYPGKTDYNAGNNVVSTLEKLGG